MKGYATRAVLALLTVWFAPRLSAQEACTAVLTRAFERGDLRQVLDGAEACLTASRSGRERALVLELEAKSFLAIDDLDKAEAVVVRLLREESDYTPGLSDPGMYVRMIDRVRRELRRNSTSSVSKMDESVLEAPATVVVVTREQIQRRGYTDLEAVLHDLPGFDISRSNGMEYANIYQRGYRSDTTNRTLFLVDGVEQNDLYSNTAHISRQYPVGQIERIEVVYGPASTMYGPNAYLGVISVTTRDPDDLVSPGHPVGVEVQTLAGPWHSWSVESTVAGRFRGVSASLTGNVYRSDEWDASAGWNFDYLSQAAKGGGYYTGLLGPYSFLLQPAFGDQFTQSFSNIARRAAALDAAPGLVGSRPLGYSDLTDNWMLSGKLRVKDLLVGFQAVRQREGGTPAFTERAEPGALNGLVSTPSQTAFYAKYSAPISGTLSFNYFGQAKVHSLRASTFLRQSYLDGPLTLDDFNVQRPPSWVHTLWDESSNQVRNEINLVYRPLDSLSLVTGFDVRNGSIQTDLESNTDADCVPVSLKPFENRNLSDRERAAIIERWVRYQQQAAAGIISDADPDVAGVSTRVDALAGRGTTGGLRCTLTGRPAALPSAATGRHYAVRDLGAFAQASYRLVPNTKLVAGVRADNNAVAPDAGTGTVFTPRLGVVFARAPYVVKVVHAQAFKAAANAEQFTPPFVDGVPSSAALATLQPERTRNLEVSASRQMGRLTLDVSLFRTIDSNVIALRDHNLVESDPDVEAFVSALKDAQAHASFNVAMFGGPDLQRKLLMDTIRSTQYENSGSFSVWGLQSSVSGRVGTVDVFGSYTYTNPRDEDTGNRVGDIAAHKANLSVANRWNKLDVALRFNYVGARLTGPGTTVATNPRTELPRYFIGNATVTYDLRPHVSVQAVVNNIFDARYSDPGISLADGVTYASAVPQPGRATFLRLLTRF